eukprot:COSAG02_NODE_2012_length_10118_cov_7.152111_2_plen_85_part_00
MFGTLKVWLDVRRSSNSRGGERGHGWFTADSKAMISFFKKIEGCGFACPVADDIVQRDDLVRIPGSIGVDGRDPGANPLAAGDV